MKAIRLAWRGRRALTSTRAAIDLASIMVGVLVLAIIGGVISATVFFVVPWAQDRAAVATLSEVSTAQGVSKVRDGSYANWADLVTAKLISGPSTVDTRANKAADCWVSAAISGSGTAFYGTSRSPRILDDRSGPPNTDWCVSSTRLVSTTVTNLAPNPSFETTGTNPVAVRTNLVANPSFELGWSSGWQGYGNSPGLSQSTTQGVYGTSSMRIAPGTNGWNGAQYAFSGVTAGATYTVSGMLKREAGTGGASLIFDWRDSSGTFISASTSTTTVTGGVGVWQRYSVTASAPANAASGLAVFRYTGAVAGVDSMFLDGVLLEAGSGNAPYFDGTTAASADLSYAWSGAAHASVSVEHGRESKYVGMNVGEWAKGYQTNEWVDSGSSSLKMVGRGNHNDQFLEIAGMLPVQPGKTYTLSAKVKTTKTITSPWQLRLRHNISGVGDMGFASDITGPPGVYDFRVTFSTVGMTNVNFIRLENLVTDPGLVTYWDSLMLVEIPDAAHPYTGPYFDGSSVNGEWNGVAHDSASTGYIRR
jgi:hypothetical protein